MATASNPDLFGKLACEKGWTSVEQVEECLALIRQRRRDGGRDGDNL